MTSADLLFSGPDQAVGGPLLVLAHGAGAPMTSPFMETISRMLGERGIPVVRFEFAYMAVRRDGGKKRPPPKAETLMSAYLDLVGRLKVEQPGRPLVIGGKSMGGRVASLVASAAYGRGDIVGLVCLGYPFHPPAKPDHLRTAHLTGMACPTLIVQGERDPFGSRREVEGMELPRTIAFHWADDGDHDLGPRGGQGFTRKGNLMAAADAIAAFVRSISAA